MYHAPGVGCRERCRHLTGEPRGCLGGQFSLLRQTMTKRRSVNELHRDERAALWQSTIFIDLDDSGVLHRVAARASLKNRAAISWMVRKVGMQDFQRDTPANLQTLRQKHLADSALSQEP